MVLNENVVFEGDAKYESTSLTGSISQNLGGLFPHLRPTATAPDCSLVGRRLHFCVISDTCEMFIRNVKPPIERKSVPDRLGGLLVQS
jgi:predicted DNA-binding protein with PD1-like motif